MITGVVKADEGRIRLKVKGPRGREEEIEAVIDTGYTASLTLPRASVAAWVCAGVAWTVACWPTAANAFFDVYEAKVVWDGKVRDILVDEAEAA
jgi:predicted aspartyl protease